MSLVEKIASARLGRLGWGSGMESACDLCFNTKLKLPLVGPILASAITSGHETFHYL